MKCENIKEKEDPNISDLDKVSDNDISDLTNNAVFKGGLSLIPKPPPKNGNDRVEIKKPTILANLSKDPINIPSIPNSSIYSSGYLSFRNKKAKIRNPENSNLQEDITEEKYDPEAITKSILEKLGMGNIERKKEENEGTGIESPIDENKRKYSIKEQEFEEKEIKNIMNNFLSSRDKANGSQDSINGINGDEEEIFEGKENGKENKKSKEDKINNGGSKEE
ncbi:MAG: hypothetical protein MJ252_28405, partial [archaeon]|nr:hypothetical protein [archaeon]